MLSFMVVLSSVVVCGECAPLYSSFYRPLVDPSVLGYTVEARFNPAAGRSAREQYRATNGDRGETLIAALGRGHAPTDGYTDNQVYGVMKLYYTYPRAGTHSHNYPLST